MAGDQVRRLRFGVGTLAGDTVRGLCVGFGRWQEAESEGYVSAVVESSWWLCQDFLHDRTRCARFKKIRLGKFSIELSFENSAETFFVLLLLRTTEFSSERRVLQCAMKRCICGVFSPERIFNALI